MPLCLTSVAVLCLAEDALSGQLRSPLVSSLLSLVAAPRVHPFLSLRFVIVLFTSFPSLSWPSRENGWLGEMAHLSAPRPRREELAGCKGLPRHITSNTRAIKRNGGGENLALLFRFS
ncbi:hypothetical protein E2C01_068590 [Portunus trituberculatus]|uniref:Secreted protein n=1 Tax=Portunus trituberculatus TaxID=210409 RepID=A0A5B7HYA4_PORTR|nr:hypothetical protein [Portunus trituberculatus]